MENVEDKKDMAKYMEVMVYIKDMNDMEYVELKQEKYYMCMGGRIQTTGQKTGGL